MKFAFSHGASNFSISTAKIWTIEQFHQQGLSHVHDKSYRKYRAAGCDRQPSAEDLNLEATSYIFGYGITRRNMMEDKAYFLRKPRVILGFVIIFGTMVFLITVGIFPNAFSPSSHATILIFHLLRYLWPFAALFLGYVCYFMLWSLLQNGPIVAFNSKSITLGFYPKRMEFSWSQIKSVREVTGKTGLLMMIEFEDPSVYEDQIGFLWLWMVARPNRKKYGGSVLLSAEGLGVSHNDLKSSLLDAFARKGTSAATQTTDKPDRDWWLSDKTST